jgi:glutaminyl-peptide cyclotransferase
MRNYYGLLLCLLCIASCKFGSNEGETSSDTPATSTVTAPQFYSDNAYAHVEKQLSFGPRVPGTKAQQQCADWMIAELKKSCDTVYVQKTNVMQPISSKVYPCINVIGSINPQAQSRVLLLCHWDSRAMADMDSNKANHSKAILAADDGASGVAVLIEMARAIKTQKLDIGVDILMADVEDMGRSEWEKPGLESTYALGTRYWARNPHLPGYKANYAICLDMVGARGAEFRLEQYSKQSAPDFQKKIWQTASNLGYNNYFIFEDGGAITDDHVEVIKYAGIPSVDIINIPAASTTGFAPHWHTMADNLSVIDKNTMRAVGQTVLQVLYEY